MQTLAPWEKRKENKEYKILLCFAIKKNVRQFITNKIHLKIYMFSSSSFSIKMETGNLKKRKRGEIY